MLRIFRERAAGESPYDAMPKSPTELQDRIFKSCRFHAVIVKMSVALLTRNSGGTACIHALSKKFTWGVFFCPKTNERKGESR